MSHARAALAALLAAALAACAANPKAVNPSTDVVDGAALSPAPPATLAAPAPDACLVDADCAAGERCEAGRCAATPAASCSLARVSFAFDSAQLDAEAMRVLRDDAACVAALGARALRIEGHADERGTVQYNVALGARRAEAVRRYLADLGVAAKLDTVSYGEELPLDPGSGEAAWAQNRRAELRVAEGRAVSAAR